MSNLSLESANALESFHETAKFYRDVLRVLDKASVPFLIGGAYAFNVHTDINRATKDLDIFIMREDFHAASQSLRQAGYETELTYPHWLGKVHHNNVFIDLIFSSGNGIAEVDQAWFDNASTAYVLDTPVKISPVEEMIWSKAFIMEKERFDGADIAHLLRACGSRLDWHRLNRRFMPHWRILLSHLVLFGFIYPTDRDTVPTWLMDELVEKLREEVHAQAPSHVICQGTLLSREQYLSDIEKQGLKDGRIVPFGNMTPSEAAQWTQAIAKKDDPH